MKYVKRWLLPVMLAAATVYVFAFSFFQYYTAVTAAGTQQSPATVVIDPGHGGEDGGASTADGILESALNLEISVRVRDLLQLLGVNTAMVRETDTAVYSGDCGTIREKKVSDIKNRVQMVNATPNALLVSIHQNFFEQAKYHGAQVFYAKTDGSRDLAERAQALLRQTLDASNRREVKQAQSVYLMEHIDCTGILIECGFLSNAQEAGQLQNADYQKKLAAAICAAVQGYLEERGNEHEIETGLLLHQLRQRDAALAGSVPGLWCLEHHYRI